MYGFAFLFLLLCVGLGLLISALSDTMQQAMFAAFFCLVLFILLSGLFASTENMPEWAQYLNIVNPLKYIIEVGRNVMLKGSTFNDMRQQFMALALMAAVCLLYLPAVTEYPSDFFGCNSRSPLPFTASGANALNYTGAIHYWLPFRVFFGNKYRNYGDIAYCITAHLIL